MTTSAVSVSRSQSDSADSLKDVVFKVLGPGARDEGQSISDVIWAHVLIANLVTNDYLFLCFWVRIQLG